MVWEWLSMVWELILMCIKGVGNNWCGHQWCENWFWRPSMVWEIIDWCGNWSWWLSIVWEIIDLVWELILMVINGMGNHWSDVGNDYGAYQWCGKSLISIGDWIWCLSMVWEMIKVLIKGVGHHWSDVGTDYVAYQWCGKSLIWCGN